MIQGGDETPVTMPRTAFQVVYPDCTVMIDSGLDKATHDIVQSGQTGAVLTPSTSPSSSARSTPRD